MWKWERPFRIWKKGQAIAFQFPNLVAGFGNANRGICFLCGMALPAYLTFALGCLQKGRHGLGVFAKQKGKRVLPLKLSAVTVLS